MQLDQLKRREFITLLGGAVVAWLVVARQAPHVSPPTLDSRIALA